MTEDGQPQEIAFVEYQALDDTLLAPPTIGGPPPTVPVPAASSVTPATSATVAVPAPGDTRYRGRRLVVLYFDLYQMPFFDQLRVFSDAEKYVATADGRGRSGRDHGVQGRRRAAEAGFHGRPRGARRDAPADDQRGQRRAGRPDRRHRRRVRRRERHVQHLLDGPAARGAPDRRDRSWSAAGAEDAGLFRQRPAVERPRQPGADARDRQRGDPRQRHAQPDRRARPGRDAADGRRDAAVAGRPGDVLGHDRAGADHARSAVAGHALRARERHGRPRDVRQQRPVARHQTGGAGRHGLLPRRVLLEEHDR